LSVIGFKSSTRRLAVIGIFTGLLAIVLAIVLHNLLDGL
jgi:hypothetical protein